MNDREKQYMLNYSLPTFIEQRYNVSLKKVGDSYIGSCIFDGHADKSPSFSAKYNEESQCWLYNCFGNCGGGNIFTLVQKKEGVDFSEAVKIISEVSGIPNTIQGTYIDPKIVEYKNNITAHANRYNNVLYTKQGELGLLYLHKERGLTDATIKEFGLGYVPTDERKYRQDEAYINDRISFPIHEVSTHANPSVIGMCYRTLEDVYNRVNWDGERKYKLQANTKGELTNVWKKGNCLFNYHRAYKYIREFKSVIVVEGYMDCISLWQAGVKNVVSVMGADISDEQMILLSKLSKTIILYLDNDETGTGKMYKNINRFIELGCNVKVLLSPDGKDGADLCVKFKFNTQDIYTRVFGEAVDATTFIMDRATKRYTSLVNNARRAVLEMCLPLTENMDTIEKSIFLDDLSKRLSMDIRL